MTEPVPMPAADAEKLSAWENNKANIPLMAAAAEANNMPELMNCMANLSWAQASAAQLPPPEQGPA